VRNFTAEEKLQAVRREIKKRVDVYKRLVGDNRMSREEADYQIDIMRAIADDLSKEAAKERLL